MTNPIRALLMLCLTLALPGCSALSALGGASEVLEIYELRPPALSATGSRRGVELVVEEPIATGALNTDRIMVRPAPLQAQYLPAARWSDTAPVMLQTVMVRSLSATDAFGSVGRRPIGTIADYALLGELTDFQAETAPEGEGALVRVRLSVRLVREADARVVASRAFDMSRPAPGLDPDSIAAAFDAATADLMADLLPWVLSGTGRR